MVGSNSLGYRGLCLIWRCLLRFLPSSCGVFTIDLVCYPTSQCLLGYIVSEVAVRFFEVWRVCWFDAELCIV